MWRALHLGAALWVVFAIGTAKAAAPQTSGTVEAGSEQKQPGQEPAGANPAEALEYGETIEIIGTTPVPGLGTALEDVPATVQTHGAKEAARRGPWSPAISWSATPGASA